MFASRYRYLMIAGLAAYSFGNSLFSEVFHFYGIRVPSYELFLGFCAITALVWEGNRIIAEMVVRRRWADESWKGLIACFLAGMVIAALASACVAFLLTTVCNHLAPTATRISYILALTYGTRINLFLHILNVIFFYSERLRKNAIETEELRRLRTQAELQAIKNQINPHFLFNNLNVLSGMVIHENAEANRFIEEFSKVYRHILGSHQRDLISVEEELEFVNPYLFLLEKRFPESISIQIDIPRQFLGHYLVPVSMQMLIENSTKHNIASRAKPLMISISISPDDRLKVTNNVQTKVASETSTKFGLSNIGKRYEMFTGKTIEIIRTDSNFTVLLPLIPPE